MKKKNEKLNAKITSIIGEGTIIDGDYNGKGAVRMDGCINGNVEISGLLILGAKGRINGDVVAPRAVIGGEMIGNLDASDKVELTGSARVIGDIRTKSVVIDEHAVFQGKCDMNQGTLDQEADSYKSSKVDREGRKSAKEAIEEALKEVEDDSAADEEFMLTGNEEQ